MFDVLGNINCENFHKKLSTFICEISTKSKSQHRSSKENKTEKKNWMDARMKFDSNAVLTTAEYFFT